MVGIWAPKEEMPMTSSLRLEEDELEPRLPVVVVLYVEEEAADEDE